jgi:hypothetical protein
MHRYFKLVALNPNPDWLLEEYRNGRVRFGWSGPGSDLRRIQAIPRSDRSRDQQATWSYTKFLLERIIPGDRIVLQHKSPLRGFLIAEVTEEGYTSSEPQFGDFNHILHARPLVDDYIPVNAVPQALKHDLSKRGQYYQIYPELSITTLDRLVDEQPWKESGWGRERKEKDEIDSTLDAIKTQAIREISRRWPAKSFEKFCARLCEQVDFIEVNEQADRYKGWDLLIRIVDPLTHEVLPGYDNVPVQCKNFTGDVRTSAPIADLRRCFEELTETNVAYLFILGSLTDAFQGQLTAAEADLQQQLGREVELRVVGEDRIAELYLRYMISAAVDAGPELSRGML